MDIQQIHKIFLENPSVSTDSRTVNEKSIFFALRGDQFNGNEYAEKAILNGASYAIIDDPEYDMGAQYILVDDSLSSLQNLARYHRETLKTKIIAVTGTNGKTTTKELLNAVLSSQYYCVATKGNLNNHIGVPLTLLSITQKHEIAIVEMGANHPGEIDFLCKIAQPDFGMITNIGKAHLEGFGNLEGVLKTKTELYRHIGSHSGKIFLNSKNKLLTENGSGLETIKYGSSIDPVFGETLESFPFLKIKLTIDNSAYEVNTNLIGAYNLENIVAAACVGNYLKVEDDRIIEAIENYSPTNNRSQFVETKSNKIILDAYNANPSSMKVAIENFCANPGDKKLLLLGDMLELGKDSLKEHQLVIDLLTDLNFDNVILVGKEFYNVQCEKFVFFQSLKEAEVYLDSTIYKGYEVLLKASRGIGIEKLISFL